MDVRHEAQVCNGAFVADEPLSLREDPVEHAEDAQYLLLVPLNGARDVFAVVSQEVCRLSVIRPGPIQREVNVISDSLLSERRPLHPPLS